MKNTNIKLARYIVATTKEVNKTLEHALDIVQWYTSTTKQDEEVKALIQKMWL